MKKKKLLTALLACIAVSLQANAAETSSRVVVSSGESAEVQSGSVFSGLQHDVIGSAIANAGNVTVGDNVSFKDNTCLTSPYSTTVMNQMGTIYSEGNSSTQSTVTIGNGVLFEGNRAGAGVGIYLYNNNKVVIGSNAQFISNATQKEWNDKTPWSGGGAISLVKDNELKIGDNAQFKGNKAKYGGGINVNSATDKLIIGNNAVFEGNQAAGSVGGAIYNNGSTKLGKNTTFEGNSALAGGGIYNAGIMEAIENEVFKGNHAIDRGGAIFTEKDMTISNSDFINNTAIDRGGAIMVNNGAISVTGGNFTGNTTEGHGGAISLRQTGSATIDSTTFTGNKAGVQGGAILQAMKTTGELNIKNAAFEGNEAVAEGGAIWAGAVANIESSTFKNNKTTGSILSDPNDFTVDTEGGGAIFVGSSSHTKVTGSNFVNNTSNTVGGAIATRTNASNDGKSSLSILSSNFDGNKAKVNGGAISAFINSTIEDTSFTNNSAGAKGGAIWTNQDLTINAVNSNVVLANNKAALGSDVFMNKENANLNINAAKDKSVTLASGVSGSKYNMNVNEGANTGTVVINSEIQNAVIKVQNGTFHLAQGSALNNSTLNMAGGTTLNTINNQITAFESNLTLSDNIKLAADINAANSTADNFSNANVQGKITLDNINIIGNTTSNNVTVNLAEALGINPNDFAVSQNLQKETKRILTPIRYLQGGVSEAGILTMNPTGNSYKDFNPAVMASPVAAQLGGFLTQLNSYDEAFRNMDMYMLMTKKERESMKFRNKYANAGRGLIFDPAKGIHDNTTAWARPYATFESVSLRGGAKVDNIAYGSFFGGESKMYELSHGWNAMWGAYAGYNGSHQNYDGVGIYQNGGTLGIVGMAYKGNFFGGLTVNAGANAGEASTMYGKDNFSMLMSGVAAKTGYNFELADGKFIVQPNFMMSYSFVNTFDYTNAAGVHIKSDPLNAITFEPGVKFIGNLKNGWQPYAGVSVVWNALNKTKFMANNVSLPELSVKPYVRYGVGVRKTWGDRLTGFLQAFVTSGGRNGVGLQAGLTFALGREPLKNK